MTDFKQNQRLYNEKKKKKMQSNKINWQKQSQRKPRGFRLTRQWPLTGNQENDVWTEYQQRKINYFLKKNQTEILELKSTITENKKFTGGFNSRIEQREEKEISELEDN